MMSDTDFLAKLQLYGDERGRLAHAALAAGRVADHDYFRHGELQARTGVMHWTEREWRNPDTAYRWQGLVAEAMRRQVLAEITPGRKPFMEGATGGLGPAAERAAAG
jgi:hypothetical protein